MDPITLRLVERILTVGVGALAIYLGYSLFLKLPEKTDSEGKVILPGKISVYVSRVGPGVFFALVGASVIGLMASKVVYETKDVNRMNATVVEERQGGNTPPQSILETKVPHSVSSSRTIKFQGAIPENEKNKNDLNIKRSHIRVLISVLNGIPAKLRSELDERDHIDISQILPEVKFNLLLTVWGKDWGEPETFLTWIKEKGGKGKPPQGLEEPAEIFQVGGEQS